jgi:hypothetical protein
MDPRLFDLDGRMLTPRLLAETKALWEILNVYGQREGGREGGREVRKVCTCLSFPWSFLLIPELQETKSSRPLLIPSLGCLFHPWFCCTQVFTFPCSNHFVTHTDSSLPFSFPWETTINK